MSEPRDCSGQKQDERKEANWYSEKSAEDLLEEMEVIMDEMTDVDYDSQKIDGYLTALNKKAPLDTQFTLLTTVPLESPGVAGDCSRVWPP